MSDVLVLMTVRFPDSLVQRVRAVSPRLRVEGGPASSGSALPRLERDRADKRWAENRFERFRPIDLDGSTVGIVGYGSVGREVARLCRAFGARVLATKRDLKHLEDHGYALQDHGDPGADLATRLYPPQALTSMAAECDFPVVTVPL